MVCAGNREHYRWLIAWMARAVQYPAEKPETAVVLRGSEGVGKGVAIQGFGRLFGQHFFHATQPRHVVGHFNAHLKSTVVLFADEAVFAGDPSMKGPLYGLITEKTMVLELKFVDAIQITSYLRVLMASNNDWVVPAGPDARRFAVFDVADSHRQDHAYFAAIVNQLEDGGSAALLHYLLNEVDCTGVNLRNALLTEALLEQKIFSLSPAEKFWLEVLKRGSLRSPETTWQGVVPTAALHAQYVEVAQRTGVTRRATETELGMTLKKLVPGWRPSRPLLREGRVQRCWEFPPLKDCRAAFERRLRQRVNWETGQKR